MLNSWYHRIYIMCFFLNFAFGWGAPAPPGPPHPLVAEHPSLHIVQMTNESLCEFLTTLCSQVWERLCWKSRWEQLQQTVWNTHWRYHSLFLVTKCRNMLLELPGCPCGRELKLRRVLEKLIFGSAGTRVYFRNNWDRPVTVTWYLRPVS